MTCRAVIPALIDQPTNTAGEENDDGGHVEPALSRPDVGEAICGWEQALRSCDRAHCRVGRRWRPIKPSYAPAALDCVRERSDGGADLRSRHQGEIGGSPASRCPKRAAPPGGARRSDRSRQWRRSRAGLPSLAEPGSRTSSAAWQEDPGGRDFPAARPQGVCYALARDCAQGVQWALGRRESPLKSYCKPVMEVTVVNEAFRYTIED